MEHRLVIARRRLGVGIGAVVVIAACAYLALPGFAEALSYLLPTLVLLAALAARRYPGERTLLAIIGERGRHRVRSRIAAIAPRFRPRARVPRGGALIAASLAVRPPPLTTAIA
jgi:hypothetical protein